MKRSKKRSCGCVPESKETPRMEAEHHPKSFLKKAAKMSERKRPRKKA